MALDQAAGYSSSGLRHAGVQSEVPHTESNDQFDVLVLEVASGFLSRFLQSLKRETNRILNRVWVKCKFLIFGRGLSNTQS